MSYPSSRSSFENRKLPLPAFAVQQTVAGSQTPPHRISKMVLSHNAEFNAFYNQENVPERLALLASSPPPSTGPYAAAPATSPCTSWSPPMLSKPTITCA